MYTNNFSLRLYLSTICNNKKTKNKNTIIRYLTPIQNVSSTMDFEIQKQIDCDKQCQPPKMEKNPSMRSGAKTTITFYSETITIANYSTNKQNGDR